MKIKLVSVLKYFAKKGILLFLKTTNTVFSVARVLLFSSFNPTGNKIKNVSGCDCFILGNGPSLKEVLKSEMFLNNNSADLFVVNDFAISEYYEKIKPKFYVIADPGYWSNKAFEQTKIIRENVIASINLKTNWELTILVPAECYKTGFFQKQVQNKNVTILFFNTTEIHGFEKIVRGCYKYNLGMPQLQNVLVGAIYLAINIKYKKIYIIGADHSWLNDMFVNDRNQVCLLPNHFYGEAAKEKNSANVWLKCYGEPYRMDEILVDLSKMFKGYHLLNQYASSMATKIYNLTPNSFIDAFERKQSEFK